tara:strand:+ start:359 stop:499 length:141 start_codon:yes stop_codon:yes gene_type:complete
MNKEKITGIKRIKMILKYELLTNFNVDSEKIIVKKPIRNTNILKFE